jgi:CRP-like cAMP-binding protein
MQRRRGRYSLVRKRCRLVDELPPCIRNIGADCSPACGKADCTDHIRKLGCVRRTLQPRQHLFMEGDARNHVYVVKSGAVCLYRMLRNGRRQVVGFKLPGEFVALGDGPHYRYCAEAIGATEVRSFQTWIFHAAAAKDPRFLLKLYEAVARDLARTQDQAVSVGQRDADGSVAAFLLNLAGRSLPTDSGGVLSLPMSRADIADYLGLSLETVSRIFTSFKRLGLVALRGRRGVRLIDRAALRAIADANGPARNGRVSPRLLN